MDDITEALIAGEDIKVGADRTILRHAVMRQIFCPYSGVVLDVRRALLLDGSDYARADGSGRGKMDIMTADVYDMLLGRFDDDGLAGLEARLGYKVDVLDGRKLFK